MLAQEITAHWPGLKLKEEIGHGAYGRVYKVLNTECSPPMEEALKVISIPLAEDEGELGNTFYRSAAETLAREATILSDLSGNPYIVRYYDHAIIPRDSGVGYDILIRMELLTPFKRHVAEHGLLRQDVIKVGIDICRALELCRKRGVIHRDIKPENIFISDVGNYKLGDFGVAVNADKTLGGLSKKGTYSYMAPEVYKGADYGPSIDIYSLGMILYRLLNNDRDAFVPSAKDSVVTFDDTQQALSRRMRGDPLPCPENERGPLWDIVKKATAPLSADRYSTPEEMRAELEMLVDKSDTALLRLPGGGPEPETGSRTATRYSTEPRVEQEQRGTASETQRLRPTPEGCGQKSQFAERSEEKTEEDASPIENDAEKQRPQGKKKVLLIAGVAVLLLSVALIAFSGSATGNTGGTRTVSEQSETDQISQIEESETNEISQTDEAEVVSLGLDYEKVELAEGESITLTASVGMSEGDFSGTVQWTSSDTSVVQVESTGMLTATVTCLRQGDCYVTATAGGYSKSCDFSCTAAEQDETAESASATGDDEVGEISAYAKSDIILQGDSVKCVLEAGGWLLEYASGAEWYSEDESIATIDEDGYVTGISPGTAKLGVNYEGSNATFDVLVVEVDGSSTASITSDYDLIGLQSYTESTVTLTFGGVEKFGATVYASNLYLLTQFGDLDGYTVPLTISSYGVDEGEYWVTVLLYDMDDRSHILAAKRIQVDVN
ncbi:MAG: protein kinase [Clostridiales bacterium]|nr:protein kinase [Clostridiales bacterium]